MVDISNSSELRLAGYSMTQLSGEWLLNARARRCAQAEYKAELTAKEDWRLSSETRLLDEGGCRGPVYIKRRLCMFHISTSYSISSAGGTLIYCIRNAVLEKSKFFCGGGKATVKNVL
jgi:hypothetical protein